jgi:peptidoglycan/LPS O-acetylase OafA/YrhL
MGAGGRYPALDGLRGTAALLVLFNHLWPLDYANPVFAPLRWVALIGWTGVDLFFVLSGFLITGILVRHREAANYFSTFYAHRALRIFPIYFALLVLCSIYFRPDGAMWPHWLFMTNLWMFNSYLGMTHLLFIAPAWSLAIEEQFYIVWSAAVHRLSIHTLFLIALATLFTGIVLRFVLMSKAGPAPDERTLSNIFYFTLTHLDGLCGGIMIRLLYERNKLDGLRRVAETLPIWIVILAVILFLDDRYGWTEQRNWYQPIMLRIGFTVIAVICCCLVINGLIYDGVTRRVFDLPLLQTMGRYSYCMYLYHLPVAVLVGKVVGHISVPLLFALQMAATIGLAALSYRFVEGPILRAKSFFRYALRKEAVSHQRT